jgi:1-acyl-sn-glycerol-3-phosphate acyltransferase
MKILRTTLFYSLFILSILAFFPFVLLARIHSFKLASKVCVQWTKFSTYLAKWICGIKWEVSRETELDLTENKSFIYLSKHQSTWETLFLRWYLPDAVWVAKKELSRIPFFGWGMAASNPIFIDRKKGQKAFEQILEAAKVRTAGGESVLLFPEGTRQKDFSKPANYKAGGVKLASNLGLDIIPISHNAGYYWPKGGFALKPGTVKVVIGKPIPSENKEINELLEETKDWIEDNCQYL